MKRGEYMVTVLPEQITAAREARGLSKAALARAAGITPGYVTLIEQGKQKSVTSTVAQGIAGALEETAETIFEGFSGVATELKAVCGLSPEEKNRFAEEYIGFVRRVAWENRDCFGFFADAAEEAQSFALLVFAEALNTFDPRRGSNFKTFVAYAIKARFRSELRRATAQKRSAQLISLDTPISDETIEDYHSLTPSRVSVEREVLLREECRAAIRSLTATQRRDKYIQELAACVGL